VADEIIIAPYESVGERGKVFTFGMNSAQLAEIDKQVYYKLRDSARDWTLERRGGYSTELVGGKLVAAAFRLDPSYNHIMVGDADFSDREKIERLKTRYEHTVYADGESVLFPTLGVLYSVTPFREGFEAPRAGVFNVEIIAFSQDRLQNYQNASRVLTLQPLVGVNIAVGKEIRFGMTRAQVKGLWGEEELLWDERNGAHGHVAEYRFERGLQLRYRPYDVVEKPNNASPLYQITVIERNGWQVEVDGIRIFNDDKLAQMKAKYEFANSKKGKATVFPTLGILAIGCGEKKNSGKGADGKYVILGVERSINNRFIDIYD
jgi:hypothetical protein